MRESFLNLICEPDKCQGFCTLFFQLQNINNPTIKIHIVQIENKVTIWHKGFTGILPNLVNQVWQIKIFDQKIQTCSVNGLKAKNQFYNFVHKRMKEVTFQAQPLSVWSLMPMVTQENTKDTGFSLLIIHKCGIVCESNLRPLVDLVIQIYITLHSFRWPDQCIITEKFQTIKLSNLHLLQ